MTTLIKKKGTRGGILGYSKIKLLEKMNHPFKGKRRDVFLAEGDGELILIVVEDLIASYYEYTLQK